MKRLEMVELRIFPPDEKKLEEAMAVLSKQVKNSTGKISAKLFRKKGVDTDYIIFMQSETDDHCLSDLAMRINDAFAGFGLANHSSWEET